MMTEAEDAEALKRIRNAARTSALSEESLMTAYLASVGRLSFEECATLAEEFSETEKNETDGGSRYLKLFNMSPRSFGQTWGESHIRSLFPEFRKATRESLAAEMPEFDGEFDLWLNGIKVEVKACRAAGKDDEGTFADRAFSHEEAKANGFKYHFQQLKPTCCDVFIWIGVCRDELLYWVLTGDELKGTGKFGSQHRTPDGAESEPFEGQVFMTEEELKPFSVKEDDILSSVVRKGLVK